MMTAIAFDAREYKLLLDPARLPPGALEDVAQRLWHERIAALAGSADGSFDEAKTRHIVFRDTRDGALAARDLVLRERRKPSGKGDLTLKLRVADLMIAVASPIGADGAPAGLEEDIAPLATMALGSDGRPVAVLAEPPSIRSRFARAAEIALSNGEAAPADLAALAQVFDGLDGLASVDGPGATFVAGPLIREQVTKGLSARFADDAKAAFAMSVWHGEGPAAGPLCAEVSFKVDLDGAPMSLAVATAAHNLFTGMQRAIAGMLQLRFLSKTALAVPRPTHGG